LPRMADSGTHRYTVTGVFPAIMSRPVKSEPAKQRTIFSVKSG
jgi:hypothetical protein